MYLEGKELCFALKIFKIPETIEVIANVPKKLFQSGCCSC